MKQLLFIVSIAIISIRANAQTLTGKILDKSGSPLTGAVIRVSNTSQYAIAGFDGTYSLKTEAGKQTCEVTFIGMEPQIFTAHLTPDQVIERTVVLIDLTQNIESVTVVGSVDGKTIASARTTERVSDNVMNVVSAKSIELSPDLDVASVVQRVSGVSIEQNGSSSGNSHSIIRGMSKRYNYTLINGVKIPSPDDKNRYVPLDLFPSELLDRLEVSKNLTPSMEGDAIGGVINMVLKDAPNRFQANANLSFGYHEIFMGKDFLYFENKNRNSKSPFELYGPNYQARLSDFTTKNCEVQQRAFSPDINAGLSVGNRFYNNKLGAILAMSYSNNHKGAESTRFEPELLEGTSQPKLTKMSEREYYNYVSQYGFHTKFDYRLNGNNTLKLYSAFLKLNEDEIRDNYEVSILGSDNISDSERKTYETRFRKTDQRIVNTTLQGIHKFNDWNQLDWSIVYSNARKDIPDEAYFVRISNSSLSLGQESELIAEDGDNKRTWRYNKDQDYDLYLNHKINFVAGTMVNEILFGGLYRFKTRKSFYNSYYFDPSPGIQAYGHDWQPDDQTLTYGTWEKYEDVGFRLGNPGGSTTNEFNHKFNENIIAGYIQLKTEVNKKFQVLTGARIEATKWNYTLLAPRPGQEPKGKRNYTDILPSMHCKYKLSPKSNLRASYYYSVIRPGYYEILPYIDKDEDYTEIGNPDIKRIKGHNFDFRYENYFQPTDQVILGVFYKKIIDPIEYARYDGDATYSKISSMVRMPDNFGTATNFGFELDFTKYFNKFGIKTNYTFTQSEITHSKQYKSRVDPEDSSSEIQTYYTTQTRPLQGQSQHIGNATFIFKDQQVGLNIQLSFVYTGERIKNVSSYIDNDEWEEAMLRMDFSVEQSFGRLSVFAKAKNLLDTPYKVIIKQALREDNVDFPLQGDVGSDYIIRKDIYKRSFKIGIRYKFN